MKVIQLIPNLRCGDAVGNDAIEIAKVISGMGYETGIYAKVIDKRIKESFARDISKLPRLSEKDVVILNHCTGSDLTMKFQKMNGRKMMIYHNITPPNYFKEYDKGVAETLAEGYRQTRALADIVEYCMPVSEYNAADLRKMGYKCPMFIRPILIPFEDYKKEPSKDVMDRYSGDGYTNILFVGRIAPNKKQEDVISAFAYYQKHINERSRLFLVGGDSGLTRYSSALKKYVAALGAKNVIFTGHTPFSDILAYYKLSDLFLCMSEHEGFCVPLAEAMAFEKPVVAFAAAAIPDTLSGSGALVKDKDPVFVAMLMDRILTDSVLRMEIIKKQNERLKDFSYNIIKERFERGLRAFIEEK